MRLLWSQSLPTPAVGLRLAREAGALLLWDEDHLARHDRLGQSVVRIRTPGAVAAAAVAEDGSGVVAVGKRGQLWRMTLDLVPSWERSLSRRPLALAVDALGDRLAVTDEAGGLHVFDRDGKVIWRTSTPRPLLNLAFVPEEPVLIGTADFGLVCAYDRTGKCLWRDGLVAHVGSLAVSGDGSRIFLACFTDGLCGYSLSQPRQQRFARAAPARLAALDYRGEQIVTAGLSNELVLRRADGEARHQMNLSSNIVALALEPLGESAVVILAAGELVRVSLPAGQAG